MGGSLSSPSARTRALNEPAGGQGRAWIEISPDGMHWVPEGSAFALPTAKDGIGHARVSNFGCWLRLAAELPRAQRTSQGSYPAVEILVVEIETDDGLVGAGEGLARRGATAYAGLVDTLLRPVLIGQDPAPRRALWRRMRDRLSGRPGGQFVEAIAAVDMALWDLAGKRARQPIHRLLGGMGRSRVRAYASSINWLDDAAAEAETARAMSLGFREIKVKLGQPVDAAIARAKLIRKLAPDISLGAMPTGPMTSTTRCGWGTH